MMKHAPPAFRRIVTGHDRDGKSVVVSDTRVTEGTLGNFNFWNGRPDGSGGGGAMPFFPAPGETIFRVFRLPAPDPAITPEVLAGIAAEFFAGVGSPDARRDTSRHPLMHVTPTTDYIMLLSGSASLLLDRGDPVPLRPFDAVVQRATNHAWIVTGSEPATFLGVLTGTVAP